MKKVPAYASAVGTRGGSTKLREARDARLKRIGEKMLTCTHCDRMAELDALKTRYDQLETEPSHDNSSHASHDHSSPKEDLGAQPNW